jgi:DNA modification methylase
MQEEIIIPNYAIPNHLRKYFRPKLDNCYICHLVSIFREYRRVLRTDGTLFLNIADSYASSPGGYWPSGDEFDCTYRENQRGERQNRNHLAAKPKDLIGIPWMLAMALRDDGWWLRSTIVWKKRNCMPSSAEDRPTTDFEYIFLLAKNGAKPSFWTHRDGFGSRAKPAADYRWFDNKLNVEWDTEPDLDWKEEKYTTPEGQQAKRWKRYNLWKGHAYYYNAEAIKEPNAPSTNNWREYKGDNTAAKPQFGVHGENSALVMNRGKKEFTEKYYENGRNKRTLWTEGETYQNVWNLIGAFQEAGASDEMVEKATAIFGEMLGSDSSIIDIPTRGFSGAHFAVFPPDLAKIPILAGSSDTACPHCGAAWFPRKEKVGEFQRRYGTGNAEGSPYEKQSSIQAIWEDKGLQPTCACEGNDGSGASVVADIFSGAGTLCMVAKKKRRHWLGVEAAQKYVEMSENRIGEAEPEVDPDKDQPKLF